MWTISQLKQHVSKQLTVSPKNSYFYRYVRYNRRDRIKIGKLSPLETSICSWKVHTERSFTMLQRMLWGFVVEWIPECQAKKFFKQNLKRQKPPCLSKFLWIVSLGFVFLTLQSPKSITCQQDVEFFTKLKYRLKKFVIKQSSCPR